MIFNLETLIGGSVQRIVANMREAVGSATDPADQAAQAKRLLNSVDPLTVPGPAGVQATLLSMGFDLPEQATPGVWAVGPFVFDITPTAFAPAASSISLVPGSPSFLTSGAATQGAYAALSAATIAGLALVVESGRVICQLPPTATSADVALAERNIAGVSMAFVPAAGSTRRIAETVDLGGSVTFNGITVARADPAASSLAAFAGGTNGGAEGMFRQTKIVSSSDTFAFLLPPNRGGYTGTPTFQLVIEGAVLQINNSNAGNVDSYYPKCAPTVAEGARRAYARKVMRLLKGKL